MPGPGCGVHRFQLVHSGIQSRRGSRLYLSGIHRSHHGHEESIYYPTGLVTVQQLTAPPQIFRYVETWNATPGTELTQFYYESPIFLAGSVSIDPTLVQVTKSSAPEAQPYTQGLLFLAGNSNTEGYFTNPAGTGYFFTGNVTPNFDYPGTYSLTSADGKIFNGNLVTNYPKR